MFSQEKSTQIKNYFKSSIPLFSTSQTSTKRPFYLNFLLSTDQGHSLTSEPFEKFWTLNDYINFNKISTIKPKFDKNGK